MAQDILQLKMLKMIIEAYSNHYILCKNQDIRDPGSAPGRARRGLVFQRQDAGGPLRAPSDRRRI